jgi:hypothetical protein
VKRTVRLASLATVVAALGLVTIRWDTLVLDGVSGELLAQIAPDERTEYSPGYSARSFRAVALGTTTSEVEALLGPPLSADGPYGDERETTLYYSKNPSDGSYRIREIVLRAGRVVRIHTGYWYD